MEGFNDEGIVALAFVTTFFLVFLIAIGFDDAVDAVLLAYLAAIIVKLYT